MKFKWMEIGILIFAILTAGFFIAAGIPKLTRPEAHIENFVRWGYPSWFVYVTGVVEVLGAGLLVFRGVRLYGVGVLGVTMVGAALTHLRAGEMAAVPVPLVLLVILGVLGILSWKKSN